MSNEIIITEKQNIVAIADAVRNKTGSTAAMNLNGIVNGINGISTSEDLTDVLDTQEEKLNELLTILDGKAQVEVTLQDKTVTPTTSSQIITADSGYDGLDTVTVNAIPSEYIIPTGQLAITTNGTHDVSSYATVDVDVASGSGGNTEVEDAIVTGILTEYTNDRVISIGNYAFASCSSLTTVNFPAVTTIGDSAFNNCKSLASVSFPNVTTIGSNAFANCKSLTSVNFPNVTSVGYSAFAYCYSLTSVSFPVAKSIGRYAFAYCSSLTTANFPVVTTIGDSAFYGCQSLTSVSFPVAKSIGTYTFYGCQSLTTANFPVVTSIGTYAFYNCKSLTSANFPAVTSIGSSAFNNCKSLASVSFPNVTTIGSNAFSNCSSLTTANFPAVKTIGNYAFANCYNLLSLYITTSRVCTLSNSSAFYRTPIADYTTSTGGVYGSIFVPASLVDSYKTATNWSYFADRIAAIDGDSGGDSGDSGDTGGDDNGDSGVGEGEGGWV